MTFLLSPPPTSARGAGAAPATPVSGVARTGADRGQFKSCRWFERRGLGSCGLGLGHRRPGKNDHPLRTHLYPRDCAAARVPEPPGLQSPLGLDLTEISFPAGSWLGRQPPSSAPAPGSYKMRRPSRKLRRRRPLRLRAAAASGESHLSLAHGRPIPPTKVREPVNPQLCHLPSLGPYAN